VSASETVSPTVRQVATEILVKVDAQKAFADVLLHHAMNAAVWDDRDRGLLNELVYGTLRWRGRLDAELRTLTRRPLETTEPFLRNLLRLSLYQLRFLDKIPPYAIVHQAVTLAKAGVRTRVGGFVNAVLRRALRDSFDPPIPDPTGGDIKAFAEYWSHPAWLVERWIETYGSEETTALLGANNQPSPLVLRANLLKNTRDDLLEFYRNQGIEALATPWSPQGILLPSPALVRRLSGFADGRFQVQGEASQLVSFLLSPLPGERILDACAAPGGKSTHIAELIADNGEVTAVDISKKGLEKIADNVSRLGLRSIKLVHGDSSEPLPPAVVATPYDGVLVDAPCSALGTLRSHPEIKWQRTEKDIARLAELQTRILDRTASLVKAGGVLVYSTCTMTREENENVVKKFLASHERFVLDRAAASLPEQARSLWQDGYLLALPQHHNTDGFFAARLRKVA
jgi:16S rRNA (cytosine967-C5)-methyltransferase